MPCADLARAGHPPFHRDGVRICGAGHITSLVWRFCRASLVLAALIPTLGLARASAQGRIIRLTQEQLAGVLPLADRFDSKAGDPPVFKGYSLDPASGVESLMGYAFITSDFQPEVEGYSAPIRVLVGMDLTGALTGIEILYYRESLQSSRGDFLNRTSFLSQFQGKFIGDPFRVRRDIDAVSGATITSRAMSLGIRNSARRVAAAYLRGRSDRSPSFMATISLEELDGLLWTEMVDLGLGVQFLVTEDGSIPMALSLAYIRDHPVGELLLGQQGFQEGIERAGPRAEEMHVMMLGVGGADAFSFRLSTLSFVQDGDTLMVGSEDQYMLPMLTEGKVQGEVRRSGILLVDRALDLSRPFDVRLDLRPRQELLTATYSVTGPPPALASTPELAGPRAVEDVPAVDARPTNSVESDEDLTLPVSTEVALGAPASSTGVAAPSTAPISVDIGTLIFDDAEEDETGLSMVLARTSWTRVALMLLLLGLAMAAFRTKSAPLRWVTLTATLLVLGVLDGGMLSVSHILSGISVGPAVYLSEVPLFLIVSFTVVTTLLWGRVFCGFLCPFGVLQDLLERVIPRRFHRELPRPIHERAQLIKYFILALVLAPALMGSSVSLFQYFEPFGTVFYWSSSRLLWAIAIPILVASVIVPRFYCRYACPLGAALALGSLLSPFRIRRVEQCGWCRVCEQKCPTRAIHGPDIDFKECVRCNVCEIQLIEQTGVCRHDMETIRPRLIKLRMATVEAESA